VSNGQVITVYIGIQPAPVPEATEQAGDNG
jgi:hypothetical protein